MRYFIVVGEASGDLHASNLIKALREADSAASFAFMGGDLMAKAAGKAPLIHYSEMAFMGIAPVLKNLGKIRRVAKELQAEMKAFEPDIFIAVDYPGFNLRYMLPYAKDELGIHTTYYISPKIWAWKEWRIKKIKRYVDLMLSILPFEPAYYASHRYTAHYIGNPTLDALRPILERYKEQCSKLDDRKQIALLSGSRKQELKRNLPIMLEVVKDFPQFDAVIAGAPGLSPEDYEPYLKDFPQVKLQFGQTYELLLQSRAALVTSGTATLETALLKVPQIVCYRMSGGYINNFIFKHFFNTPYISLVNLIVHQEVLTELFGGLLTVSRLRSELSQILQDSERRRQILDGYSLLMQDLDQEASCSVLAARKIRKAFAAV